MDKITKSYKDFNKNRSTNYISLYCDPRIRNIKMFRFFIAVTLIACSLAATVPDATETEEFKQWSGRIVGGNTATPGQFPYQASMRSAGNAHFCGGSIINHRWVVCACEFLEFIQI